MSVNYDDLETLEKMQEYGNPSLHPTTVKSVTKAIIVKRPAEDTWKDKYIRLDKQREKFEKSYDAAKIEIVSLKKELAKASKNIELKSASVSKLTAQVNTLEATNEKNKQYIRKIEKRLVLGSKEQFLADIKLKLESEIDALKVLF